MDKGQRYKRTNKVKNKYFILLLCILGVAFIGHTILSTSMRYHSNVSANVTGNVKENRSTTYNVVFNANGGTGTMSNQTIKYATSENLSENLFTRTGNTFNGWNTQADGNGTEYDNSAVINITDILEDNTLNLYAQWKANIYTVTADANGGTIPTTSGWIVAGGGTTATKNVTYDSTYETLPVPTRTGYTFNGWRGINLLNYNELGPQAISKGQVVDSNGFITDTTTTKDDRLWQYANSTWFTTLPAGEYIFTVYWETLPENELANYHILNTSNKYIDINYRRNSVNKTWSSELNLTESTNIGILLKVFDGKGMVMLRKKSVNTNGFEPYYITSSTTIVNASNHTLTAIWEEANYGEYNSSNVWQNGYLTLAEAFTGAASGNTIKVINGITETKLAKVESGKILTLETKSNETTTMEEQIANYGTLTISGAGNITTSSAINLIENAGTLNISNSGTISSTNTGSYSLITNPGTVNKTGSGTLTSSTANNTILGGNINISAGIVSSSGHDAINTSKNVIISGTAKITCSTQGTIGSAIYVSSTGSLTVSENAVIEKTGTGAVATIGLAGSSTATLSGGIIKSASGSSAYGIGHASSGTVKLQETQVTTYSGNAVRKTGAGNIEISGGTITTSKSDAIYITNKTGILEISGGTITALNAAGISMGWGTAKITGGEISGGNYGIWMSGENATTVTLGTDDGTVSTTSPKITATGTTGQNQGVHVGSGTLNFYDGVIIGKTSIPGNVRVNPATNYTIVKTNADGKETATLGYTITADANGGTIPATSGWTVTSGSTTATKDVALGSTYGTLPVPTKSGYSFKGWNGKNLLNYNNISSMASGIGQTVDSDGYLTDSIQNDTRYWQYQYSTWFVNLEAGKYTFTIDFDIQATNAFSCVYIKDSSGTTLGWNNNIVNKDKIILSFTISENTDIGIELKVFDGKCRVQLEQGTESTPWEPYYVTSTTPVTKSENHTLKAEWYQN